jgi:hypothetical protein
MNCNSAANAKRNITEAIGLMRGVLADGNVNKAEAEFMLGWILSQDKLCSDPILRPLLTLLHRACESDRAFSDNEGALLGELLSLVGGTELIPARTTSLSSTHFLTPPPPAVRHKSTFVLTGTFRVGARSEVEEIVSALGGFVASNITQSTDFLIVGEKASPDWANPSFGRKIEAAHALVGRGFPIAIISETHWARSLPAEQRNQ